jgi:hypothetical protein
MKTAVGLDQLLGQIFDGAADDSLRIEHPDEYEKNKHDFIFHMTDWESDLGSLADLFQNPDRYDEETASRLVIGFLYHVIPHLRAAGRLLLDEIPDAFATDKAGREKN